MARIGIYGGSFNPIHYGHIGLVQWVVEHTDLDEVWLLVSPNNPLKDSHTLAPEQQRLIAARQAVAHIPHVRVSDFEFALPRPSYTANTLRALQSAYPEHAFTLLIGEDNLSIFNQWREYEYILSNYRIFVYPRHNAPAFDFRLSTFDSPNIVYLADAPYFDISSTQIRNQLSH